MGRSSAAPAQFHPRRADGLWHVLHVVARAEFVLKLRDELLSSGYEPLDVVFGIESTRRGPTRQHGSEIRVPPSKVGTKAAADSQCFGIDLDVVEPRALCERRSSPNGHQFDPASRCWPSQQLSRSRDYIGLDLFSVLWVIIQHGRQTHIDPQVAVVPYLPIRQPEFGGTVGGPDSSGHNVARDVALICRTPRTGYRRRLSPAVTNSPG